MNSHHAPEFLEQLVDRSVPGTRAYNLHIAPGLLFSTDDYRLHSLTYPDLEGPVEQDYHRILYESPPRPIVSELVSTAYLLDALMNIGSPVVRISLCEVDGKFDGKVYEAGCVVIHFDRVGGGEGEAIIMRRFEEDPKCRSEFRKEKVTHGQS